MKRLIPLLLLATNAQAIDVLNWDAVQWPANCPTDRHYIVTCNGNSVNVILGNEIGLDALNAAMPLLPTGNVCTVQSAATCGTEGARQSDPSTATQAFTYPLTFGTVLPVPGAVAVEVWADGTPVGGVVQ